MIDIVKDCLKKHDDFKINVSDAYQEEDWWYVLVWPEEDNPKTYQYYVILAEVEMQLQDKKDLNVTLVPTASPDKTRSH